MTDKRKENIDRNARPAEFERELRRDSRDRSARERLGGKKPACVNCGIDDPILLEQHHLEGQHYGDTLVPVCRNCHRILSSHQKDHPPKITEIPDPLESAAHFLEGLADLSELLVKKFREFAEVLIARADPHRGDKGGPES